MTFIFYGVKTQLRAKMRTRQLIGNTEQFVYMVWLKR